MNTADNYPVHLLISAVLGEARNRQVGSTFDEYIKENPSVFDLIKLGAAGLQDLGLTRAQATTMIARGNALALSMARAFREHYLRADPPTDEPARLQTPPTYMDQFAPNINASAPVGSIENSASTTAYLVSLREWVRDKIVPEGDEQNVLPLESRRPDLDALLIDEMAVKRRQSRLEIADTVLEKQIQTKLKITDVKAYLRKSRFHNGLPYDHDWESINHVVGSTLEHGALGDIIRRVDLDYPYFKNAGGQGSRADVAMQLSSTIGPLKLALLLEAPYFALDAQMALAPLQRVDPRTRLVDPDPDQSAGSFYRDNFGNLGEFLNNVRALEVFSPATRLDQRGVEALVGRGAFTPKLSANASALGDPDLPLSGVVAGARYIHAGQEPAIELERGGLGNMFRLFNVGEDPMPELEHRMDRINRKCRLDRMLQLPSHHVDQLLIAAMQAEERGTGQKSIWIRSNTLRFLGLFKELNIQNDCQPEEFAALVDVLSVYGQDGQLAHFDRVFNRQATAETPLRIDGVDFPIVPRPEDEQQTVHQICSGLEINFETYRFLATVIAKAYGLKTHLKRSLPILSSFWRLVWLGRMAGLTPIESTALLQTLSEGEGLLAQLAGEPILSGFGTGDGADALSSIRALVTCANWTREFDLPVLWLVQNVNPVFVPTLWSVGQEQLLLRLRSQVMPVCMQQATLLEEGAPLRDKDERLIDWISKLAALVDEHGLVIGRHDETEALYRARADSVIKEVVTDVLGANVDPSLAERLHALIRVILLRCRDEQRVVVEEGLAVYLKLDSLLAAQVLAWSQGHAYTFLQQALALPAGDTPLSRPVLDEPELFLELLAELERRARIAAKLGLSPQMLRTLLTGEQYLWFSLASRYEISIRSVYYLTFYCRMITRARQPEEKMLDYLTQVNQLPEDMSPDAVPLVRDAAANKLATYFGCGLRHVLTCAEHITRSAENDNASPRPILCNLAHLDLLVRTLTLAGKGMDAAAALGLGMLAPWDPDAQFASAAQNALESLARFNATTTVLDSAEIGQSFTTRCVVDNPHLIANVLQEVAEFECTLLDFYGEPLKNVEIHWATDLGAILTPITKTDDQGRARAVLQAGSRMGTAHVSFNLPLYEATYAPSVVIDCDEATLSFKGELSSIVPRDPVLAGRLWQQEMYSVLTDDYGNRAAHRQVAWSTTLGEIRPGETFTDKDGLSRVWISSLSPGLATIAVGNVEGSHRLTFSPPITFADQPRIRETFVVCSSLMVNETLMVKGLVVGLDDAPVAAEEVMWWTSTDPSKVPRLTAFDGISNFEIAISQAGELTIYAQLGIAPAVELKVWVPADAVIENFNKVVTLPIAGAARPTLLWVDVKEAMSPDARPIARYPVLWVDNSSGREVNVYIPTDAMGRSVYPYTLARTGQFRVIAMVNTHPLEQINFHLTVIPAFAWNVVLITQVAGEDVSNETIIPGVDELTLYRDAEYRLVITAVDSTPLLDSHGALGWSSDYSSQALAMVFEPPLATRVPFTDEPFTVRIRTGNVRNGRFQLSLFCDLLNEALVLDGTLGKRPASQPSPSK